MKIFTKRNIIVAIILAFLIASVPTIVFPAYNNSIKNTYIFTITDKNIVSGNFSWRQDHYYLIYGRSAQGKIYVLKNDDTAFLGKFNSSDFQEQLTIGKTYKFYTVGKRYKYISSYPNIISFTQLE